MKNRITAFILALAITASLASCGKSEEGEDPADTTTTAAATSAAKTTKKESDSSSKAKTTKKTKKSSDSKSDKDNDDKDSSSKETKKTKATTVEIPEDIEVPDGEFDENNELGWTKSIYDKYMKHEEDPEAFLMSLTLDEFLIVVSGPDETVREQYNVLHGINQTTATEPQVTAPPETMSVTVSTEPEQTIDMTEDATLKSIYGKYNIDLDFLLAITGLNKAEFFYLWNEKKDQNFRKSIANHLYGYNSYSAASTEHLPTAGKVDMRLIQANWDDSGKLHLICSINSGITSGIACNIQVPLFEVIDRKGNVIARKDFGYITEPVDPDDLDGDIEGLTYNAPVIHEFIFEYNSVSKVYADIRAEAGLKINYKISNGVFDPSAMMVP